MSIRVCEICGEVLNRRDGERPACLLCLHRTLPEERASQARRLTGLIDLA